MLKRTLPTTLLVALACAPAAGAAPRAHTAARAARRGVAPRGRAAARRPRRAHRPRADARRCASSRRGLRHLRGDERERAVALLSRPTDADAPADERYTVPELPPLCDANFCVHSVGSGADAASAGHGGAGARRGERGAGLRERDARLARAAERRRRAGRHLPEGARRQTACSASPRPTPARTSSRSTPTS